MQIDRASLEKLLTLNDRQLMSIITRLVSQSGINPAEFSIDPKDIQSIRSALANASDEDLQRIAEQYEANQNEEVKKAVKAIPLNSAVCGYVSNDKDYCVWEISDDDL